VRLTLALIVAWAVVLAGATASAADVRVTSAALDSRKAVVGQPVQLLIHLANDGPAEIGPVEITVVPRSLAATRETVTIPAGGRRELEIETRPTQPGSFSVRARVAVGGATVSTVDAGILEVVEAPGAFAPYRDVLPLATALLALTGTLVTLIVTVWKQSQILVETRRQKAAETVSQIVLQVARDYYGTMSGAIGQLASAARRLQLDATAEEREHLLVRCFFFFGIVLHKDNEFSFGQGLLFLPDLWAEADMRRMIDEVLDLVPLTQAQEAVIHKCFSDVAVLQRAADASAVTLKARNLYELERLLLDRFGNLRGDHRRVQEVFDDVKDRFADPDAATLIQEIERAMRGLMEYEFTSMFADFYRARPTRRTWRSRFRAWRDARHAADAGARGDRPRSLPAFDDIVRTPSWQETRRILEQIEARRGEKEARPRAG
jgi:hypothetical protein